MILKDYDFPAKSTYNLAPSHLLIRNFFVQHFWPIFTLNSKRAFQKMRLGTQKSKLLADCPKFVLDSIMIDVLWSVLLNAAKVPFLDLLSIKCTVLNQMLIVYLPSF